MEWGVVAVIAVAVIFLGAKLPQIARNVGKAQTEFKKGLKEGASEEDAAASAAPPAAAPPAAPPVTQDAPPADQPPAQA
ncbi:MAG: twin-arginine translocase TatA/TatE family subunit [Actinomycetota bacterium]